MKGFKQQAIKIQDSHHILHPVTMFDGSDTNLRVLEELRLTSQDLDFLQYVIRFIIKGNIQSCNDGNQIGYWINYEQAVRSIGYKIGIQNHTSFGRFVKTLTEKKYNGKSVISYVDAIKPNGKLDRTDTGGAKNYISINWVYINMLMNHPYLVKDMDTLKYYPFEKAINKYEIDINPIISDVKDLVSRMELHPFKYYLTDNKSGKVIGKEVELPENSDKIIAAFIYNTIHSVEIDGNYQTIESVGGNDYSIPESSSTPNYLTHESSSTGGYMTPESSDSKVNTVKLITTVTEVSKVVGGSSSEKTPPVLKEASDSGNQNTDGSLKDLLVSLGIASKAADTLIGNVDSAKITSAIAIMKTNIANGSEVKSHLKYLETIIANMKDQPSAFIKKAPAYHQPKIVANIKPYRPSDSGGGVDYFQYQCQCGYHIADGSSALYKCPECGISLNYGHAIDAAQKLPKAIRV
jgi:hypothetical protein